MWISRDLRSILGSPSLPARIVVGPRQSGKSALLARYLPDAVWLSLDDLQTRQRAQRDPALLFDSLEPQKPVILDEGALAPELFPEIKRRIDAARRTGARPIDYWITGSNRALLNDRVRESLAGRASHFTLHSCSVHELGDRADLRDWLFRGGFPELYARPELDPSRYFADYVRTFVQKDVAVDAGILQTERFIRAVQLLASRTATMLNATEIGQLVGVKGQTVTSWIDLLHQNALVHRLTPYASNLAKRVVRTPKIYMLDAGLAAYLQGWKAVDPLLTSPQAGPLFETLVLGELVRARDHLDLPIALHYWRTKEGEEVDFLVEVSGRGSSRWIALDAKLASQNVSALAVPRSLARELPGLDEVWIVTPAGSEVALSPTSRQVPIRLLTERLRSAT